MPKFLFFVICLTCTQIQNGLTNKFIVWDVGQGEWTTLVTITTCFHFDIGGEKAPLKLIKNTCGEKKNEILLSHWDWDHINFLKIAPKVFRSLCLRAKPLGLANAFKSKLVNTLKLCEPPQPAFIAELTNPTDLLRAKRSNDMSRVFLILNRIVVSGDSPSVQEKIWSQRLPATIKNPILVLGHHGSRTSTSEFLLNQIPDLKATIASARKSRYGHPHSEVLLRLKMHKTPTLLTEDWGSIHFEL